MNLSAKTLINKLTPTKTCYTLSDSLLRQQRKLMIILLIIGKTLNAIEYFIRFFPHFLFSFSSNKTKYPFIGIGIERTNWTKKIWDKHTIFPSFISSSPFNALIFYCLSLFYSLGMDFFYYYLILFKGLEDWFR